MKGRTCSNQLGIRVGATNMGTKRFRRVPKNVADLDVEQGQLH